MATISEKTSKTIIFLNGPPRTGKDYLTNKYIDEKNKGVSIKFAQPIRNAAISIFSQLDENNFDSKKSEPLLLDNEFGKNITLREWMIKFGEDFMKPSLGNDIFAKMTYESVISALKDNDIIFITDLGFSDEINYFIERHLYDCNSPIYFSHTNIIVIQLYRDGCSWKNDSRSYVKFNRYDKIKVFPYINDENAKDFISFIDTLIDD